MFNFSKIDRVRTDLYTTLLKRLLVSPRQTNLLSHIFTYYKDESTNENNFENEVLIKLIIFFGSKKRNQLIIIGWSGQVGKVIALDAEGVGFKSQRRIKNVHKPF